MAGYLNAQNPEQVVDAVRSILEQDISTDQKTFLIEVHLETLYHLVDDYTISITDDSIRTVLILFNGQNELVAVNTLPVSTKVIDFASYKKKKNL